MPVVVTGLGLVSAGGVGEDALEAALAGPRPAVVDGAIRADVDFKAVLGAKGLRSVDRVSRLTLVCAQEALKSAGLDAPETARGGTGVVLGSAFSGLDSIMGFFTERLAEGANYVTASNFGNIVMNAAASQVALRHALPALNATQCSGAASGADALGWARDLLLAGRADVLLAGGVEEVQAGHLAVLAARGAGFVPGEGAALITLERADHAEARGARARAVLAGYGQAFDPGPLVGKPADPAHAARAIQAALADAGVLPADVELVVTSASGAAAGDQLEAAALAIALGDAAPIKLAPKAHLGETLGAAGALGVAAAVLAIEGPDGPAVVLVTALDPDGHQAALVLRAPGA